MLLSPTIGCLMIDNRTRTTRPHHHATFIINMILKGALCAKPANNHGHAPPTRTGTLMPIVAKIMSIVDSRDKSDVLGG